MEAAALAARALACRRRDPQLEKPPQDGMRSTHLELWLLLSQDQNPPLLPEDEEDEEEDEPLEEEEEVAPAATQLDFLLLSSHTQLPPPLLLAEEEEEEEEEEELLLLEDAELPSVPKQDLRWLHFGVVGAPGGQGMRRHFRPITPTPSLASF